MRIVLVGAGVVGFHLAEQLSGEGHDISVVDSDPALVKRIDEKMDVLAVLGDASVAPGFRTRRSSNRTVVSIGLMMRSAPRSSGLITESLAENSLCRTLTMHFFAPNFRARMLTTMFVVSRLVTAMTRSAPSTLDRRRTEGMDASPRTASTSIFSSMRFTRAGSLSTTEMSWPSLESCSARWNPTTPAPLLHLWLRGSAPGAPAIGPSSRSD